VPDLSGEVLLPDSIERLKKIDLTTLPRVDAKARIGPCVGRVGKFVCVGLNYADHAVESCAAVPNEPVLFMKATSAICGHSTRIRKD
jgi:2-keto-4-pentenoate hydratase/2-oxohepta-3-ene-1,7-dioic acid hydratase in catechol pathway